MPKKIEPLERVIYVRISKAMADKLEALCAKLERETGLKVKYSSVIRKLITDACAEKVQ